MTHKPSTTFRGIWKGDCKNDLCISLIDTINSATKTLDLAVYGVRDQPEISEALLKALNRGVKIRLVYDKPLIGENYYGIEKYLDPKILENSVHDTSDAIMHNKFVIADECKVWTGSANLSNTDIGGYNSNTVGVIESCYLGGIYQKEFEQLYSRKFGKRKKKIESRKVNLDNGGKIQVFFSPKSDTINKAVIPLLESANETINLPIFYLTHKSIFNVLLDAKKKGIKIRVILDATAAENEYVLDEELRKIGIPTKVENWGGKMHMKTAIIDDKHIVMGSMNFTKAGNFTNEENTIILWDVPDLAKQLNQDFITMWDSIPDEYLTKSPKPESKESINSCFDGMDNNFDNKVDKEDENCL